MSTGLKLGPTDHGRPMTFEEFRTGDYTDGYHYELIQGKLYVTPLPHFSENWIEDWILGKLKAYAQAHPDVLNFVTNKSRVFLPDEAEVTAPEPDVAAYRDIQRDRPFQVRWEEVSPVLVVEVISHDDPDKDLVRNAELYLRVPSIQEYWVFDNRAVAERPTLRRHRRRGKRWSVRDFSAGETYVTRLLPGFELLIDPMR
jgi:Uma2 family endonuclease